MHKPHHHAKVADLGGGGVGHLIRNISVAMWLFLENCFCDVSQQPAVGLDSLARYEPSVSGDQASAAGSPRHNIAHAKDMEELSELEKSIKKAEEIR